jgi:broad specificity phosphatase PhoE
LQKENKNNMKVYFVRHGATTMDDLQIHRPADVELSKVGIQQAKFVAKRFKDIAINNIISSDFRRTRQTAEIVAHAIGKELTFSELLRERRRPRELEGKGYKDPEVLKVHRIIHKHRFSPYWHYSNEENFFDLKYRAERFIDVLLKKAEESTLVISHEAIIRMIVATMIFGYSLTPNVFDYLHTSLKLKNTGITVMENTKQDKWIMVTWNDHAHL